MKTKEEIVESNTVGATAFDLENWVRKAKAGDLMLTNSFADTQRGQSRLYSYDNVLELAFLAAFVSTGIKVSSAAAYARSTYSAAKYGGMREWLIFGDDARTGTRTDDLTGEKIAEVVSKQTVPRAHVLQIGEIKRRVDALFAEGRN